MAWKTWTLTAGDEKADQVTISNLGASVLSWSITDYFQVADTPAARPGINHKQHWEAQKRQIIDGYRNEQEAHSHDGYRSAVLVPWNERIRDGKFVFDGREHDINRGLKGGNHAQFRGLMTQQEFEAVEVGSDYLHLTAEVPQRGDYDYRVKVDVKFRLCSEEHEKCSAEAAMTARLNREAGVDSQSDQAAPAAAQKFHRHRLEVLICATNLDDRDAPITLGWHPYLLCQGGAANTIQLSVPAQIGVVSDANGIPLPGIAAFQNRACPVPLVHRTDIDFTYTHLQTVDGVAELRVNHQDGSQTALQMINPPTGIGAASFNVYSGQRLSLRRGQAIAVKPLLTMPDGFNRPECDELIRVAPGEEQTMNIALEYRTPGLAR